MTEADIQVVLDEEDKNNPMTPEERDRKELEIRQRLKIPAPLPFGGRELPQGAQALWRQYTPEQAIHFKMLTDRMADPNLAPEDREFIRKQRDAMVAGLTRVPTNPNPVQTNQQDEQQSRFRTPMGGFGAPRDAMGGLLAPPPGFVRPPDQRVVGRGLNRGQMDALAARQQEATAQQVFRQRVSQRDFTYQDQLRLNKLYAGRAAIQAQVDNGQIDAATGLELLGQIENGSHLLEAMKASTDQKAKKQKIMEAMERNAVLQKMENMNAEEKAKIVNKSSWLLPNGDFIFINPATGKETHIKPEKKAEKPIEDADWLKKAEAQVRMSGGVTHGAAADHEEIGKVARELKRRHQMMELATKNAPPASVEEAKAELDAINDEFKLEVDKNGKFTSKPMPPVIEKRAQSLFFLLNGPPEPAGERRPYNSALGPSVDPPPSKSRLEQLKEEENRRLKQSGQAASDRGDYLQ